MWHLRRSARVLCAIAALLPGAASGQTGADSQSYALVDGSTFQRGCFEPCACPIGQEEPLVGTFSLLFHSDNGLFAEYDMLDVRWKVEGSTYATPPDAPITGSGTYRIGGEFAIEQRMTADLQIADEPPASFDSGRVFGGAGFPDEIEIEISRNGRFCFDTVMHVVAKAQALPEAAQNLQLLVGLGGVLGITLRRAQRRRC